MTGRVASQEIIDISVPLRTGTPEWPGDTPWSCRWTWDMNAGDSVNLSAVTSSPHVGTHADAPFHVDPGWARSEAMPASAFLGRTTVVDVTRLNGAIEWSMLGTAPPAEGRLLLKTGRSIASGEFPGEWPWLSVECIRTLVAGGLRLVGVDAPSVDARDSKSLDSHRAIFSGGAYVLENLDLGAVSPGEYELLAAPLRVEGIDAAPVRALLRRLTSG